VSEIRKLRKLSGLSQALVAKKARVDRSSLCLAERGLFVLSVEQERRVRAVLLTSLRNHAIQSALILKDRAGAAEPARAMAFAGRP